MAKRQCSYSFLQQHKSSITNTIKFGKKFFWIIGLKFKTKYFKLVGIILDDNFKWFENVIGLNSQLAKTVSTLKRLKQILPLKSKVIIYNFLFKFHNDYGLPIWDNAIYSSKRSFFKLQKAVRATVLQVLTQILNH